MARQYNQINPGKGIYGNFDIIFQDNKFTVNLPGQPGWTTRLGKIIKNFNDAQRFIDFIRPEETQI